jgi:hypothetical protein
MVLQVVHIGTPVRVRWYGPFAGGGVPAAQRLDIIQRRDPHYARQVVAPRGVLQGPPVGCQSQGGGDDGEVNGGVPLQVVADAGRAAVIEDMEVVSREPSVDLCAPMVRWPRPPQGVMGVKIPQDDGVGGGGEEGRETIPGIVGGAVAREGVKTHHRKRRGRRGKSNSDRFQPEMVRKQMLKGKPGGEPGPPHARTGGGPTPHCAGRS